MKYNANAVSSYFVHRTSYIVLLTLHRTLHRTFTVKIPSFTDYFNLFTTMPCILLFFVYIFVW
jgi:hypothetical protein